MRKIWNSFLNELAEQQVAKVVIEWLVYIVMFSVISNVAYDGDDTAFAVMIASYAMMISISNKRKLKRT
jgi:N-glycosylase/DNA lyase